MIDFYTFATPNGRKVSILLEELGLEYTTHVVDIRNGDQFKPEYLAINPNGKIPAIVDHDGPDGKPLSVFESGAILIYLCEKTASNLLPVEPRARAETMSWLMFQMAGVGPMFGQTHHFLHFAPEKVPYGIERYSKETRRLYGVLEQRLTDGPYVGGLTYTIADIATFPWVDRHEFQGVDLKDFPHILKWHVELKMRTAVQVGMAIPPS